MILEGRNIGLRYPNTDYCLFENLSFKITEPGFHALFGASGVGKTSLAKIITGDLKGFSGEIKTGDMDDLLYSYNLERLPGWSSVGNHLAKITSPSHQDLMDEIIDAFGLREHIRLRFSELSLGQQNRINLIRYLLQDFQLLIMDESLANVDELTRERIILKIKDLFPERLFLYISHNIIEVSRCCDKILVFRSLHNGTRTVSLKGQNHKTGQTVEKEDLELTMLEIMHAS